METRIKSLTVLLQKHLAVTCKGISASVIRVEEKRFSGRLIGNATKGVPARVEAIEYDRTGPQKLRFFITEMEKSGIFFFP